MNLPEALAEIEHAPLGFYVYALHRPNGIPFYIGVGSGKRVAAHEYDARTGKGKNRHKNRLIRRIISDGGQIDYRIVEFFETWLLAAEVEKSLIAIHGRSDKHEGTLVNRTDGGDGSPGWHVRPETRAKMSKAHKGRAPSRLAIENSAKKNRGRCYSEEHRQKLRAAKLGTKLSQEHKAKISRAAKLQDRTNLFAAAQRSNAARAKPIIIEETVYRSLSHAAISLGVQVWTIRSWLRRGKCGAHYQIPTSDRGIRT